MTAVLENINPYSKYGLTRRPTYNEIIGLIGENETLTGTLPDRTATRFKASPEGSFFDGLDHLEILKEQQNRIQERQMRELLMRQNIGNNTYSIARLQQQRREINQPDAEVQQDNMTDTITQTELENRARQFAERQQQTGEAHRGILSRLSTPSTIARIFNLGTPATPTTPPLHMPRPQRPARPDTPESLFTIGSDRDPPESSSASSEEMITAREALPKNTETKITYTSNISSLSEKALRFQLFIRGIDTSDIAIDTRTKGKGGGKTRRQTLMDIANDMVRDGRWHTEIEAELLKSRIKDYKRQHQARGSRD